MAEAARLPLVLASASPFRRRMLEQIKRGGNTTADSIADSIN